MTTLAAEESALLSGNARQSANALATIYVLGLWSPAYPSWGAFLEAVVPWLSPTQVQQFLNLGIPSLPVLPGEDPPPITIIPAAGWQGQPWLRGDEAGNLYVYGNGAFSVSDVYVFPSGDTTGATDAANIQAALTAGQNVQLAAGSYYISSTLDLATQGQGISGAPSAPNKTAAPTQAMATTINLADKADTDMISVTAANCYIGSLELIGNGANQSGGTALVNIAAAGTATILERCMVRDGYAENVLIQSSAQACKLIACWINAAATTGVYVGASDCSLLSTLVGSSGSDNIYVDAAVTHILGCDIYSSSGGNGINIGSGQEGTLIANCGIDRNWESAINIGGNPTSVIGCTIHSNSQASNGGYPSINVDISDGGSAVVGSIYGNTFWLDSGITNLPSYHIYYVSSGGLCKAAGNVFAASSYDTGTINTASASADANETS